MIVIFSVQNQEEPSPSEIFRFHISDLTKAASSNLDEITDNLFSQALIGKAILQSTNVEGVSSYRKARKIVYELFNQLEVHNDPKLYLIKICDVLLKQDDLRLNDIAISIKAKL